MLRTVLVLSFSFCIAAVASAHCQVPCGIYGDQTRFLQMLEDEQTISKSQIEIGKRVDSALKADSQSVNQVTRWVMTKEEHAGRIQTTIAAYFMAQRIKPGSDGYTEKLTSAHAVMVAAMKCKQSTDPDTAKALEKAIFDFYRVYEGKEPKFKHSH